MPLANPKSIVMPSPVHRMAQDAAERYPGLTMADIVEVGSRLIFNLPRDIVNEAIRQKGNPINAGITHGSHR